MGDIFPPQVLPYAIGIWAMGAVAGPISTFLLIEALWPCTHFLAQLGQLLEASLLKQKDGSGPYMNCC